MAETPAIADRNLEATTNISLKREPACFAFLSARSVAPPMPIDSINLDLASADYFQGRASLWTTLEMRSSVNNDRATAILGFDESLLQPFDNVVLVTATTPKDGEETLFQLPRTDSFLRAFAKMSYTADQALHDLLEEMERVARRHKSDPVATPK